MSRDRSRRRSYCCSMKRIAWFEDIRIDDVASVGGKNASLGEMYRELDGKGVQVPNGFATTAEAYREFLDQRVSRPTSKT